MVYGGVHPWSGCTLYVCRLRIRQHNETEHIVNGFYRYDNSKCFVSKHKKIYSSHECGVLVVNYYGRATDVGRG